MLMENLAWVLNQSKGNIQKIIAIQFGALSVVDKIRFPHSMKDQILLVETIVCRGVLAPPTLQQHPS